MGIFIMQVHFYEEIKKGIIRENLQPITDF